MSQPTDADQELIDHYLTIAYRELMKLELKPETADSYAAAECAEGGKFDDHYRR